MPDNKEVKRPLDSKRIDINDPGEVAYWCRALKCKKKSELEAAVKAVGTSASKVRRWLRLKRICHSLGCTESQLDAAIKAVGTSAPDVRRWLKENVAD